ncbi:hypothetical protein EJB05_26782, partial [Eragrostis curvula]
MRSSPYSRTWMRLMSPVSSAAASRWSGYPHRGVAVSVTPQPRNPSAPGQLVVVLRRALVYEEVDAVHRRVAERAVHAGAGAEDEGVPEVVGEVGRRLRGGERVLAALPAD